MVRTLLDALAASPENVPLRIALVRALFATNDFERAREYSANARDPELLLLRAKVLHALADQPGAIAAYDAAVGANPTLEDRDLRAQLHAKVTVHERLRVVSNDDTDQSEVERLLKPTETVVTFADVGGLDGIKEQIEKRII